MTLLRRARPDPGRALALGLALTLSFAALEVVLGIVSGSLALISDAGHMLVDSAGLLMALVATMFARRPSGPRRSYGYARAEVLVVPLHVALMLGLAGYIVYEAVGRIGHQPEISAWPVFAAGVVGLGINALVFRLLHAHAHDNLNARGAMFEVMADTLASVGVIISAVVILLSGWTAIDLVISLLIAALVVPRAVALLRHAVVILLEGAPPGLDVAALERDALAVEGVLAIHDLHAWSLTPSFTALSAHVEVDRMEGCERPIAALSAMLRERYGITHVTLQPETRALHELIECCLYPDSLAEAEGHEHALPGARR